MAQQGAHGRVQRCAAARRRHRRHAGRGQCARGARQDWRRLVADAAGQRIARRVRARQYAGGVLNGNAWGRPRDVVGLAMSVNMLGSRHQAYLAAGGQGAFLGDGALRYGPEQIVEVFYSFQPVKYLSISPDFQYIRNPGYNRDRGPAKFYGVRFHAEF
nr:carbohydrate porin [Cupriavidus basilensis]